MPIVIASRGTCSSPKKSAAASRRVITSSWMRRVRLSAPEPGSLKPMWPVFPIPRSWKSIPPAARMAASYASAMARTPSRGTAPSGTWVSAGAMSMWSKRFSCMKRR